MSKIAQLLITYLGIPLAEKIGKWIISLFQDWNTKRKIVKDQKKKTRRIDEAKTIEEVKSAHRSNKL